MRRPLALNREVLRVLSPQETPTAHGGADGCLTGKLTSCLTVTLCLHGSAASKRCATVPPPE